MSDRKESVKWPTDPDAIKVQRLPIIKRRHRRWLRTQVTDVLGGQEDATVGDGFDTLFD